MFLFFETSLWYTWKTIARKASYNFSASFGNNNHSIPLWESPQPPHFAKIKKIMFSDSWMNLWTQKLFSELWGHQDPPQHSIEEWRMIFNKNYLGKPIKQIVTLASYLSYCRMVEHQDRSIPWHSDFWMNLKTPQPIILISQPPTPSKCRWLYNTI